MRFTLSYLTLVLFVLPLTAWAQAPKISGYIYDNSGNAVANQQVYMSLDSLQYPPRGWSYVATTNANGYYTDSGNFPLGPNDTAWVSLYTFCNVGGSQTRLDTQAYWLGQNISGASIYGCGSNTPSGCNASFTWAVTGLANEVRFDASNSTGRNLSYTWLQAGATLGTGANFTYLFNQFQPGDTVDVTLVVSSGAGCADTLTQAVVVPGGNPQPTHGDFSIGVFHPNIDWLVGITGQCYLIEQRLRPNPVGGADTLLTAVDTQAFALQDSGMVTFANQAFGDYLIKCAVDTGLGANSNFLPTYYDSSLYWRQATVFTLDARSANSWLTLHLQAGQNPGGPGFIGGSVARGANKTTEEAGITVILVSTDGSVVRFAQTDANGAYSFSNLPYGTYTLDFDWLGRQSVSKSITLDAANPNQSNVELNTVDGVTSLPEALQGMQVGSLYPNPGSDFLNLDVTLPNASPLTLSVLNLNGQVVYSRQLAGQPGPNTLRLDLSELAEGLYLTRLTGEGAVLDVQRWIKR